MTMKAMTINNIFRPEQKTKKTTRTEPNRPELQGLSSVFGRVGFQIQTDWSVRFMILG